MENRYLPLCYYPTTVCFVDDDSDLTDAISSMLSHKFKFETFNEPTDAIEYLKEYEVEPFTDFCIESIDRRHMEERELLVDVQKIHRVLHRPDRFDEISVILVDYLMPSMTGTEFLKEIQHIKCKKVMLTGEASDNEGLEAFNKGLISQFYKKSQSGLTENLLSYIQRMQIAYFDYLSSVVIHSLVNSEAPLPQCIVDPGLVEPLFKILNSKNIAEYYLVSNEGYFLTVTYDGKLEWMIIHSADEIDTLIGMIEDLHDEYPCDVTHKLLPNLKTGEQTLFFIQPSDSNTDPQDWTDEYILNTQKLSTPKSDYYYAFAPFNADKFILGDFVSFDKCSK